ncbi:MAG: cupin domain-containing protein [Phycisphaerales bacterium]
MNAVVALPRIRFQFPPDDRSEGTRAFLALAEAGATALESLRSELARRGELRGAAIGRVRGTGHGASFGRLVTALEADHPRTLEGPFENSPNVSGSVWTPESVLGDASVSMHAGDRRTAFMKLRFERGCRDLPLHAHIHSDRFIVVLEGRGLFHVSPDPIEAFSGRGITSIPVRSRDALAFTRGVVHTFSSPDEPLVLLSGHLPFVSLDDREQYTLPEMVVRPADLVPEDDAVPSLDPAWTLLVGL